MTAGGTTDGGQLLGRGGWNGDLLTLVTGTAFCRSSSDGQVRSGGDAGLYVEDVRVLDELVLLVDDEEPVALRQDLADTDSVRFTGRSGVHDLGSTLLVERHRWLGGPVSPSDDPVLLDEVVLRNHGRDERTVHVAVAAGTDFASVAEVRRHRAPSAVDPVAQPQGLRFERGQLCATVTLGPGPVRVVDGVPRLEVPVPAGDERTLRVEVRIDVATHHPRASMPVADPAPWHVPDVRCSDQRLTDWLRRSVSDLTALLQHDPRTGEVYAAAGIPWYQALFGRDALWTARMTLPLGTELAGGTLRTLARWQGARHDPATDEAPGKVLHELRRGALRERAELPPQYYGSIDATLLFVLLLHDAWRWGLPEREVVALLPAMEGALRWLERDADPDGDGFVSYVPSREGGLVNQGWKDSTDGVARADGSLPPAPIALCEVQGYAHAAALGAASLLDAFGRPGGDAWRSWADELAALFRAAYWAEDAHGPYPAIAVDGTGARVDAVASNMGHLLASGLLDASEVRRVAERLVAPGMDSGWGLRTLDTTMANYDPLSYHCGSVWPHDTAIAVHGLAGAGQHEAATALARGLVAAAGVYDGSLPELYGGDARTVRSVPLPYPGACRPQAWSAAAAWLVLRALLGLEVDVPGGTVTVTPVRPFPMEHLEVDGLVIGGARLGISVGRHVATDATLSDADLELVVRDAGNAVDRHPRSRARPHRGDDVDAGGVPDS